VGGASAVEGCLERDEDARKVLVLVKDDEDGGGGKRWDWTGEEEEGKEL
jgi:hypothetical protein